MPVWIIPSVPAKPPANTSFFTLSGKSWSTRTSNFGWLVPLFS